MNVTAPRVAFPPNWRARAAWIALVLYIVYACSLLDFTWARFMVGLDNGARFIGRMLPPNFTRWEILVKGLTESIEIAILASVLGILLSLPIGLFAARNLMPAWVNWPARVAALMAAELGVEAHPMQKVLETHVRAHLADLAEVRPEFR